MVIDNKVSYGVKELKRLHELDSALEIMHFGFRGLTVEADRYLEDFGFSRVHHRILYVVARTDGISVGELAATLGISKQALHRHLTLLTKKECIVFVRDASNHRIKNLTLSPLGGNIESQATQYERDAINNAFQGVPSNSIDDWYHIMQTLANHLG